MDATDQPPEVPRRRIGLLLGPAFIAAVAYVDPGNFATNIQGGAKFGYMLVWVVVAASLIAMLAQTLSAKLGLVTGSSLPELIRDRSSRPVAVTAWIGAELVAMATDLAELLGAGLGLQLLTGIALFPATILCAIATFAVLILQHRGMPLFEALIAALVGVIAICYVIEAIMGKVDLGAAGASFLPPKLGGTQGILLAVGILGATVMPHVIYLHSAMMTDRAGDRSSGRIKRLLRFQAVDIVSALSLAGVVNVLMLMLAAATFHASGLVEIASIEEAHRTLTPILGSSASTIFGVSLLAAGLSASAVGTFAGQMIMKGFLHRTVPIWVRRLVTMLPALIVAAVGTNATDALVLSQVVLSFGIPPALIPLAWFVGRRELMGDFRSGPLMQLVTWMVVGLVCLLNVYLLIQIGTG